MLRSVEVLAKYGVLANDGPIGHVHDMLFDDESWVVRYAVVDTGGWLSGRKVLISPISIGLVDAKSRRLHVLLDREQIENSPDVDSDEPVSRQYERRYFDHYGYPSYWGGMGLWGEGSFPSLMLSDVDARGESGASVSQQLPHLDVGQPSDRAKTNVSAVKSPAAALGDAPAAKHDDTHLRSCKAVLHYAIQANDGLIGHVQGFLVDEATWAIRQLVVKPSHWWRQRVLIASDQITSVNWLEQTVRVELSREAIQQSPSFDAADEQQSRLEIERSQPPTVSPSQGSSSDQ